MDSHNYMFLPLNSQLVNGRRINICFRFSCLPLWSSWETGLWGRRDDSANGSRGDGLNQNQHGLCFVKHISSLFCCLTHYLSPNKHSPWSRSQRVIVCEKALRNKFGVQLYTQSWKSCPIHGSTSFMLTLFISGGYHIATRTFSFNYICSLKWKETHFRT